MLAFTTIQTSNKLTFKSHDMKQVYKGKTLNTKTVVDRIIKIYDQSTDRQDWYNEAHNFAVEQASKYLPFDTTWSGNIITQTEIAKVCGIIAALSPLKSWDENKKITTTFLATGKAKHTGVMNQKARDILASNGTIEDIALILNGNKITSFFLNLYNPVTSQVVTIDRHAISIAIGYSITTNFQMTSNQYNFFQNCYVIAANKRGIRPLQMQAITWVEWRKFKKEL